MYIHISRVVALVSLVVVVGAWQAVGVRAMRVAKDFIAGVTGYIGITGYRGVIL